MTEETTEETTEARERPLTGQVARVLNAREIAINRGSAHGVFEGMKFAVLDPSAEDVRDPETGESLGSIYRPKVEVKVVNVEDKFSIARTFKSRRVNVGGTGFAASRMFEPPKFETRVETFKTDETTWEDLDESESYVKTGDPVEEIADDADEPSA